MLRSQWAQDDKEDDDGNGRHVDNMLLSQWVDGTDGNMLQSQWANENQGIIYTIMIDYIKNIFNIYSN